VPVVVENDANAAGWAEFRFGAAREATDMLMLTVGTGLGGAVVVDRELVRGKWGVAAEVGHMRVVPGGHYCGCGHEGCWEQYASGQGGRGGRRAGAAGGRGGGAGARRGGRGGRAVGRAAARGGGRRTARGARLARAGLSPRPKGRVGASGHEDAEIVYPAVRAP